MEQSEGRKYKGMEVKVPAEEEVRDWLCEVSDGQGWAAAAAGVPSRLATAPWCL